MSRVTPDNINDFLNIKLSGIETFISNLRSEDEQNKYNDYLLMSSPFRNYLQTNRETLAIEMKADREWIETAENPRKMLAYAKYRFDALNDDERFEVERQAANNKRFLNKKLTEWKETIKNAKAQERIQTAEEQRQALSHRPVPKKYRKKRKCKKIGNGWIRVPPSADYRTYYLHRESMSITQQKPHMAVVIDGKIVPPPGILGHTALTDPRLTADERKAARAERRRVISLKRTARELGEEESEDDEEDEEEDGEEEDEEGEEGESESESEAMITPSPAAKKAKLSVPTPAVEDGDDDGEEMKDEDDYDWLK